MKNHLQRLAASVIEPSAKLHPLLGSIYDPAPSRSAVEPLPGEVQTVSTYRQESVIREKPEASESSDSIEIESFAQPAANQPSVVAARPGQPLPRSNHALGVQPLIVPGFVPKAAKPDSSPVPGESANHHIVSELKAAVSFIPNAQQQTRTMGRYQPLVTDQPPQAASNPDPDVAFIPNTQAQMRLPGRYRPLVTDPPPATAAMAPHRPAAPSASVRNAKPDRRPASVSPEREADEIHIHIGRIEVAAISQPAPRPPTTATAHKSPSLEEYLQRSDGRRK